MATERDVVPATAGDAVPDTTGGPVIDVVGHLRELRHALLPALVVAVVIGVLVGLGRSFVPATYERAATARFGMSAVSTSETFAKAAAAQFESLGRDAEVLEIVARETGLGSADEAARAVTVKANIAPGVVDVAATASSPELATELVTTTIATLDEVSASRGAADPESEAAVATAAELSELDARIRSATGSDSRAVAELHRQREALAAQQEATAGKVPLRLSLLALQHTDGTRVTPDPIPEGALAALVAFVLALEGIVLLNSRGGRTVTPAWARRRGRSLGIEVDSASVEDGRLPVPTEIHVKKLRDEGSSVAVLDAAVPAELAADADTDAAGTDPTAGSEPPAPVPASLPGLRSFSLSDRWWEETDLSAVDLAVLVVDESRTAKVEVLDCLDTLAVAEVPTRLVVRESPDFSGPFAWLKI